MKKILLGLIAALAVILGSLSPASAAGSNDPTPYTVDKAGVTLPNGETFKANGHVNIKYKVGNGVEQSAGVHFDPNNNQPGGAWIGKSTIPWTAFSVPVNGCITWVQVAGYNEHFGEGGQQPVCLGDPVTPQPDPNNKKVDICHYNGGAKTYSRIEVDVADWLNGHKNHAEDVWAAFSYTNKAGQVVNVPAQGDQTLLEYTDCTKPRVDTPITKPEPTYVDKCDTKDDVFAVAPGTGYTVGGIVLNNNGTQSITVTLADGFKWADGSKAPITFTKPQFTNEDCDLPETGVGTQQYTIAGGSALAGLVLAGFMFMSGRRKVTAS